MEVSAAELVIIIGQQTIELVKLRDRVRELEAIVNAVATKSVDE
jgi:hypothetical protein